MSVSYQPVLDEEAFAKLAGFFLESAPQPSQKDVVGFAQRVYQLGYEHGYKQGGPDAMATWMRATGKDTPE